MTTHVIWFRNDLRLTDNPALYAACQQKNAEVIAIWCTAPKQWQQHAVAPRQLKFIYDTLCALSRDLNEIAIPLVILQATDFQTMNDAVLEFCQQHQACRLFYNYQYEWNELQRDKSIEQRGIDAGLLVEGWHDGTLFPPGSIQTAQQQMYQVFTPFRNALVKKLKQQIPECLPKPSKRAIAAKLKPNEIPLFYAQDEPTHYDSVRFPAGPQHALTKLRAFSRDGIVNYEEGRNYPSAPATSSLSPWLATGQISVGQCLHRIVHDHPNALNEGLGFSWLNELFWREFYRHLLVVWPKLCRHRPFQAWTQHIRWSPDNKKRLAWQQGNTGFPIVDAGMRQLNETGWMHNRLRMICASFLVKDLLIDWREGEDYFSRKLLDGDLAANNGGWQWAASTGTDAAPYFRIFNPTTQGERFDPDGTFIRQWIPELNAVPNNAIHEPWKWASKNGIKLDYPQPLVCHKDARVVTIAAFEQAKALANQSIVGHYQ